MNKNENIERSETNKRKSIVKNKRNIKKVIFSVLFLGAIVFPAFLLRALPRQNQEVYQ